jgi:hypothetical protein
MSSAPPAIEKIAATRENTTRLISSCAETGLDSISWAP